MGVTAFTFLLVPLCLLWAMRPDRLLKLMIIAQVFEAAAALTIGTLGVQPGLLPALTFMGFVLMQLLLGARFPGDRQTWRLVRPFVCVAVWALATSYLMPRLFEGQAYVWPQKEIPPFVTEPLRPTSSNINQDIYLALDCGLVVLGACFFTKSRLRLLPFLRIYFLSGLVVAAIAVWQFASKVAGVPYPNDLFYSNPGWAILTTQSFGSVPRINATFSEPAALAGYMASIVCASGWVMLQGHRDTLVRLAFIAGLGTIALSTSTTGFATLAIIAVGVPIYALLSGSARMVAMVLKVGVPVFVLLGLAFFAGDTLVPRFNSSVSQVVNASLDKQHSTSYNDRTDTDADSLTAAVETYGLGTGWGSNRSSSLVPGILASIGIPGLLGLLWFGAGVTRAVRRARRCSASSEQMIVLDGCCGGLFAFILTALISGPTISSVTFYFLLSLLIGCAVRTELDARPVLPDAVRRVAVPA
ncbi:hypothetical protein [Lichenicoccus sp.]|uniref:hypothetical protein n=1 Tax=Lichenicoccus sp. TaxID=2781899 RepID=UPI003D0F6C01